MAIKIIDIINGPLGVGFALGFGRVLPSSIGYPLAGFAGSRIAGRKNLDMVKAVRANQWVVHDGQISKEELDKVVNLTFRHTARNLYETYHLMNNPSAMQAKVRFSPEAEAMMEKITEGTTGTIVVGPHLSKPDIFARVAASRGLNPYAIAFVQPGAGYRWENEMREKSGIELAPGSIRAIKQATKYLKEGRLVITGVDRPIENTKHFPKFFGREAPLPLHYIVLALKTGLPIYVAAAIMNSDGFFDIHFSGPIPMVRHEDHKQELIQNGEAILRVIEDYIRQAPHQWTMTYPVWPEIMNQVP